MHMRTVLLFWKCFSLKKKQTHRNFSGSGTTPTDGNKSAIEATDFLVEFRISKSRAHPENSHMCVTQILSTENKLNGIIFGRHFDASECRPV